MDKGRDSKPHVGIFGRRNNGKSTLINTIVGQDVAIVSEVSGTTTDPVKKSVEIPGIGPLVIIDTAGIDDVGELGSLRVNKTMQVFQSIDMAILLICQNQLGEPERIIIDACKSYDIPYTIVHNKSDVEPLRDSTRALIEDVYNVPVVDFSSLKPDCEMLVNVLRASIPENSYQSRSLLAGLVRRGDVVMLVAPIDTEAPEGRLILPQVQAIRDSLDNDCVCIVVKESEVDGFLRSSKITPKLVITDSQVFQKVDASVPSHIPLTGFSILLAHHKGCFDEYLKGTPQISSLKDGDRVLMLESCTHHVSCDDIGRVKIPRWMSNFTGKKLEFDVVAGLDALQRPVTDYSLVVQCGGCMITRKQIFNRLKPAIDAGVPVANYGMTIAYLQGVYQRAVQPFS